MSSIPVFFYLPRHRWPVESVPASITSDYISDVSHVFFNGQWLSWTFQTYLRLAENGYPCSIVDELPEDGVIIGSRSDMPFALKPGPRQFFACTLGGAGFLPYGQVQIVQNRGQTRQWPTAFHMPHWTQPGMIPRDTARGPRFDNAAFFGHPDQLAPELHSDEWEEFLQTLGIRWHKVHKSSPRKSDYSDIDVIVAVRRFDGSAYPQKPSTKLLNAWHAGIPAILGPESEYRAERKSHLDFVEVTTYEELKNAIVRLRDDEELRARMSTNGGTRAQETTHSEMVARWVELIEEEMKPRYVEWKHQSLGQHRVFFAKRFVRVKKLSILKRMNIGQ